MPAAAPTRSPTAPVKSERGSLGWAQDALLTSTRPDLQRRNHNLGYRIGRPLLCLGTSSGQRFSWGGGLGLRHSRHHRKKMGEIEARCMCMCAAVMQRA